MAVHLQREIKRLKELIFNLISRVENNVKLSVKSLKDRDKKLAQQIIDSDVEIDRMEVDVEEECLKILALHQPVAIDLRLIIAFMKINNDLERIGDLAANIAERAIFLSSQVEPSMLIDFTDMAGKAQIMLRKSLDALVNFDLKEARLVCSLDDEVDQMYREILRNIKEEIEKNPSYSEIYIQLLSVARQLERIADHATNISEDTIYMVEGHIVRHRDKTCQSIE
ncbi:MAG: phosphate signaling complex protein PhoU [Candidatus Aureabacteria bacterium]|nr:phosphate signaling complex protein PhoU [Candidatus Auribacterota bacterium]